MKRLVSVLALLALAACEKSQNHTYIAASGVVTPVGSQSSAGATFTLYGAKDLITGAAPTALAQSTVASDGSFSVANVDVENVSDAVVALTDGTDALFPTLSGLVNYGSGAAKVDLTGGRLFVVPRQTATALASALGKPELLSQGFVMGLVTDGVAPIAGATVKSGSALTLDVWYPSADLRSLSKTETSAAGLFLIPADPALLFLDVVAEKSGHAFATTLAPLKSGTISFAVILPSSAATPITVDVRGVVSPVGTRTVAGATVEALAPYDLATAPVLTGLSRATVSATDTFTLSSVDVTNVSQGLFARVTDDAGVVFPTISGITAWASEADADKQVTSPAHLFAVSQGLAQSLATALNRPEVLTQGFVMGVVTDGSTPVAGATINRVDGQALTVLYPSADFSSLSGTQTSASGLFVLPPDASLHLAAVKASKTGWSFAPSVLLPRPGACFFAAIVPAVAHPAITVDVAGLVTPIGVASAAGATVNVVSPYALQTQVAPAALGSATVGASNTFGLQALDVTNVSQALLSEVTSDGGVFYPTVSGLTAWASEADADKKGTATAHVFAVGNGLAQTLSAALNQPSLLTDGFVMGLVTDGSAPVAGATIARVDGQAVTVLYPSADLSSLSGTQTSANGLFVVPSTSGLNLVAITAVKTGWTFAPSVLLPHPGTCFFAAIVPAVAHAPLTVDVAGLVTAIGAASASGATVSAMGPVAFQSSTSPTLLGSGTVSGSNTFSLPGVVVTNVAQGLLGRVDDAAGAFFPTVSGITAWASEADADKQLTSAAHLFAVSKPLVTMVASALSQPQLLTDGFVMGMVTDGAVPVAGATIARADGTPLTVIYPNATFTGLSGTETSANGLFILLPDASLNLKPLVAVKAGSSFAPALAMQRPGTCYFVAFRP
jgi:hypothetical protein